MADRPHVCGQCGMRFARADTLKRHRERKRPCVAEAGRKFLCEGCGKSYTTKGSLSRHWREKCGRPENLEAHNLRRALETAQEAKEECARLQARLARLEGLEAGEAGRGAPGAGGGAIAVNAGIINHGVINTGPILVQINAWGEEALDHIDARKIRGIVVRARRKLGEAGSAERLVRAVLAEVAREIWLERPENHTAYLPNVKEDRARVLTARGWEERSGSAVVEEMHERAKDETSRKQPMTSSADCRLMDPVLKNMGAAPIPRAELRALLINMRPAPRAKKKAAAAALRGGGGGAAGGPAALTS